MSEPDELPSKRQDTPQGQLQGQGHSLQIRPRRRCVSSSASLTSGTKKSPTQVEEQQGQDKTLKVTSEAANLTSKLSEMTLTSPPPPGKIRRRNALTSTDLFLKSREMQQLEEQYLASITEDKPQGNEVVTAKALQKELENLTLGSLRRKKAVSRTPPSNTSQQPKGAPREDKVEEKRKEPLVPMGKSGKMHISLHQDFKSLSSPTKMAGNQLPDSILSRYRVADRKEADKNALILYKPLSSPLNQSKLEKTSLDGKSSSPSGMTTRAKRSGMMNRSSSDAAASYASLSSGNDKTGRGNTEEEMDLIVSSNSIAMSTHARIVSLES